MSKFYALLSLLKCFFVSMELTKNGAKLKSHSSLKLHFVETHSDALILETGIIWAQVIKCSLQT